MVCVTCYCLLYLAGQSVQKSPETTKESTFLFGNSNNVICFVDKDLPII